jgi:hypothetical protein
MKGHEPMMQIRVIGTILGSAAFILGGLGPFAGTASAAQPQPPNCHGSSISSFATEEPQGVGNFVGGQNVQGFQQSIRYGCSQ